MISGIRSAVVTIRDIRTRSRNVHHAFQQAYENVGFTAIRGAANDCTCTR